MLSPNDRPIVLLPQDRALIEHLGLSESEYRQFLRESVKRTRIEPGQPQNFDFGLVALIFTIIGLILNVAAQFFKPKSSRPAEIRQNSTNGQNVVNRSEFAPKAGFDSLQNVVELGSTVPVVYAKRETINGVTYGGVRVNTNLLWSQMVSLGGSQMLRAVFLISEATIGEIDPTQFAFGDNVLGGYDLADANSTSSRVTFYVSRNGGRLVSTDRVAGRLPENDPGNAQNAGAADVFQIPGLNGAWTTDFCYTFKPSTQTQFGVYQLIGNGLAYRVNPQLRPAVVVKTEPAGKTDTRIRCNVDGVAQAQRDKYNTLFSCRAGVIARNGIPVTGTINLAVNDQITYVIDSSSDANYKIIGVQEGPDHEETCRDVAQTVSGRQRSWDDALSIGDLYRFGSALMVCEARSPEDEIFVSEADQEPIGGGQSMTVTLRCVRAGVAVANPIGGTTTATGSSHLMRVAIASFALPRASQVVELGFRSTLGLRISGLCNFRDSLSQTEIDGRACRYYDGKTYRPDQSLDLSTYQSGTYSGAEQRYSFFKIGYRLAGSDDDYTYLDPCFGTRSLTQQATYNYVRLQMPSLQRWEFRIEPVSGWEVRQSTTSARGNLEILDARISGVRTVGSGTGNSTVLISFSGEPVARTPETFAIAATRDKNLGVVPTETGDYADAWGRLAESFVFEELQSSAQSPEHELVYVNLIAPNPNPPQYDGLALVGINLRSSTEFSQLNQLSVYVNQGVNSIHTFPEVFKDQLTDSVYGVGALLSPSQVDDDSFTESAEWTRSRRYFYDAALAQPINLRQWGSQTATYFLLDLVIKNGRFAMRPAVYFDRPEPITSFYTAGNIIEGSFEFAYAEAEQRTPKRVSVKWRQEKASNDDAKKGLFPVIREVTVREAGSPEDAPLETLDLTDFCTSETHAIDVAKYICRGSRLFTHSVRFKTTVSQASLEVGRCFKLGLETVRYEQPNNGGIDGNGVISSTTPLADGTYDILIWDGQATSVREEQLTVQNQRTNQFRNAVFCVKDSTSSINAYKVQSLGYDEDGNVVVEALYFPLDAADYSLIVEGWDVASNWAIQGAIEQSEADGTTISPFTGASIIGRITVTTGVVATFTALINGGPGSYSYQWSGSGLTISSPNAPSTSVTAQTAGTKTLSCTVTRGSTSFTATKTVTAVAPSATASIGSVTTAGPATALVDVPESFTASLSGAVDPDRCFFAWSTTPSTASIAGSSTPLANITFEAAGSYTVTCTVNSPYASDGPKTDTTNVVVS